MEDVAYEVRDGLAWITIDREGEVERVPGAYRR